MIQDLKKQAASTGGQIDAYNVIESFTKERTKYIMNEAPPTPAFKNTWWTVGVNRPYQEYVLAKTMLDRIYGYNIKDGQAVENPLLSAATPAAPKTGDVPTQQDKVNFSAAQEGVADVINNNLGRAGILKLYDLLGLPVPGGEESGSFAQSRLTIGRRKENTTSDSDLLRPLVEKNFPEGAKVAYNKFAEHIIDIVDTLNGPEKLDEFIPAIRNSQIIVEGEKIVVTDMNKGGGTIEMSKAEFVEWVRKHGAMEAYKFANPAAVTATTKPVANPVLGKYGF